MAPWESGSCPEQAMALQPPADVTAVTLPSGGPWGPGLPLETRAPPACILPSSPCGCHPRAVSPSWDLTALPFRPLHLRLLHTPQGGLSLLALGCERLDAPASLQRQVQETPLRQVTF